MVGNRRRSASQEAVTGIVIVNVPRVVVGGACNEGLDEVDTEEAEEVDEGRDESENGDEFGESDDVEGHGVADLVPPPDQKVIRYREEKREENGVGEVKRERESI